MAMARTMITLIFQMTAVLMFLLALPSNAKAEESRLHKNMDVEYLGYSDPGYMRLKLSTGEVFEADFFYDFISYDEISSWDKGIKLKIVSNKDKGLGLSDTNGHKFYKVIFENMDKIISQSENECIGNLEVGSTLEIVDCIRDSATLWEREFQFFYNHLKAKSSNDLSAALDTFEKAHSVTKKKYFEAFEIYAHQQGGSISIIYAEKATRDLIKYKSNLILNFYK